jgi:hypothetical protein
MSETNTATPLPAPDAGETTPQLNVVPPPAGETPRTRGEFNKEVEAELCKASEICAAAQKADYAGPLATRGIGAPFVTALVNLITACGQKSQGAVACDSAARDATQSAGAAAQTLVSSLQTIQGAARVEHLPEHPAKLEGYLVGEPLAPSRPLLERNSQTLIDKANTERPGGLDTSFLEDVKSQRAAYVNYGAAQGSEESKGAQERATRDDLLKDIIAQRKKIQYAADTLWPPKQPASVQARTDFKLPQNRPYSY